MFKHAPPVLIADDNPEYTTFMVDFLHLSGFAPQASYSLSDAFRKLSQEEFDLAVITADLSSPPVLALCEDFIARSSMPLIIQSDVVPENFVTSKTNVIAKAHCAKALLKLIEQKIEEFDKKNTKRSPLSYGPLYINVIDRTVTLMGRKLELTATEFDLLEFLAFNVNQPVNKDILYQRVLGRVRQSYDRSIDVHISSLRHKIDFVNTDIINIQSIRGVGYTLNINQALYEKMQYL